MKKKNNDSEGLLSELSELSLSECFTFKGRTYWRLKHVGDVTMPGYEFKGLWTFYPNRLNTDDVVILNRTIIAHSVDKDAAKLLITQEFKYTFKLIED